MVLTQVENLNLKTALRNSPLRFDHGFFLEFQPVFDLDDYTEIIVDLKKEARLRLQKWIKTSKKQSRFRGG
jgi:hypothetical protein